MKYIIKRLSDNKYLLGLQNLIDYDINVWTEDISEAQGIGGGKCESFRRNFSHLDEFEIMEKNPL
jgi:hypothetical protein